MRVPRVVLSVEDVHKSYGGKTLLDGGTFVLEEGERAALVGPNGCGKTTLLRIVLGDEKADSGRAKLGPRTRVARFDQHATFPREATVRDALAPAGVPADLAAEMDALDARIADPALYEGSEAEAVLARYAEVQRLVALARAEAAGRVGESALLADLGLDPSVLDRPLASLSGGERTRVLLARTLADVDAAGLLVLDEPTNHLDLETIEWLEDRLLDHAGAVLLVSHDRAFLDNVATRIVAFERQRLAPYDGNYEDYERVRDEDEARLALRREREAREMDRQRAVIEQFRHQKRFNGQMASRLGRLSKYRAAIDRTPDPLVERVQMSVGFPESFKSSNDLLRARGLAKQYEDRLLFHNLDFDLKKGDRLGLVGANGTGKTTLLRILTGRDRANLGNVEAAPGVKGRVYAQGHEDLVATRTLGDEVLAARAGLGEEDVRALLGRFGFRNERDLERTVATLSGGERSRLQLLKTVVAPSNLLVLDEPTNHLDLASREALVGALNAYRGTILVASHDRWFLDSVVTKIAVLSRGKLKVFTGDLTEARTQAEMEAFAVEKPTVYRVRKGFKDFEAGVRYAVGTTIELLPTDLSAKRLWRTAIAAGWMEQESE